MGAVLAVSPPSSLWSCRPGDPPPPGPELDGFNPPHCRELARVHANPQARRRKVKKDLYQTVTDAIIKDLEFGVRPWLQPWIRIVPRSVV